MGQSGVLGQSGDIVISRMVRHYKRKTNQHSWSEDSMKSAILAYNNKEMGFRKAALSFGVPQTTLERRAKQFAATENLAKASTKALGRFKTVFTEDQEVQLVEYIKTMEARLFGLTSLELRSLAYQLAVKNNISHTFCKDDLAGVDWLYGFMKRHSDLSLRQPEATSAARASGFNPIAVGKFFALLTEVVEKNKLTASQIFNVDETVITCVPKSHSKVIACRGRRQVGAITSAERGQTITAEICMVADGSYMPPMLIFPRVRNKPELIDGGPPGAWAEVHPSGWIQTDLFLKWFDKFVIFSRASKTHKVLLLLDGHVTHTKSLELIYKARDAGVILLCFPPHCTHRLQPLDVAFMKPLSLYYSDEVKKWLREHAKDHRVVTQFQIASLFGKAYLKASTMTTAISGFRATGIWPVDANIFKEHDFLASAATDIDLNVSVTDLQNISNSVLQAKDVLTPIIQTNSLPIIHPSTSNPIGQQNNDLTLSITQHSSPGCSHWSAGAEKSVTKSFFALSPEEIQPIPKSNKTTARISRRRGKTAILTESPYKNELLAANILSATPRKFKND
ncbi:uncharacterized protein LOC132951434 [Metopolophium dirhodum]|uniref:uncharacterized protein LOC132951434 n=1 Tax=Metopolophium dirhodum TaxID=44670 RepID=UPI00298FF44A|nr:uncharacterized protein LOC132951434 [Metopolophium dirhodum]